MALLSTRHIQTNDCGRSALIGPGLTWLASQLSEPMALTDVGASAGLNLLCDRYRIDYGGAGATGPSDSPVQITCRVAGGNPPIAPALPPLRSRIGIDRSPIDLGHPDDARWLLACVWPDTDRLERTAASIHLAQQDPPRVVAGEANDTVEHDIDEERVDVERRDPVAESILDLGLGPERGAYERAQLAGAKPAHHGHDTVMSAHWMESKHE